MAGLRPIRYEAAIIILLSTAAPVLSDDQAVRAAFLATYQPHAQELEAFYTNIHCTTRSVDDTSELTTEVRYNLTNWLLRHGAETITDPNIKKEGRGRPKTVECENAQYYFSLTENRDGQYKVRTLVPTGSTARMYLCFMTAPFADYQLTKQTFLQMAHDKSVRFISFQDCTWLNENLKELRVEVPVTNPFNGLSGHYLARFYFAQQDGWVCRGRQEAKVETPNNDEDREVYIYDPRVGLKLPELKRTEKWVKNPKYLEAWRRIGYGEVITREHNAPINDADFRLTAFGFPEPAFGGADSGQPLWVWLIGLGVGTAICAMLAARLRQRLSLKPSGREHMVHPP